MYNNDPNAFAMSIDGKGALHIPKFIRKLRSIDTTDKLIIRVNDSVSKITIDLNEVVKQTKKTSKNDKVEGV